MLPVVGMGLQAAWIPMGTGHLAQTARILGCSGHLLSGSVLGQQAGHGAGHLPQHLRWDQLPPAIQHQDNDKQQQQQLQCLQHVPISSGIATMLALQKPSLYHQMPWPMAVAPYMPMDISGRRHVSFFRFVSGFTERKPNVPDAADADAALKDYQELRARLDKLEKPSSIRTTSQVLRDAIAAVGRGLMAVWQFLLSIPGRIASWRNTTPEEWAKWRKETWATVKHEAHHYWVGTKLLGYEIRIASRHAWRAAQGKQLSRRERAQLTRTTADLFRLVPMIVIIVIPFLEFALPILLRIFPNMLPSTFEDKLKKEEELKRRLTARLEIARFLQDTVAEMASDIARRKGGSTDAQQLYQFIQKVRSGHPVDNADMIRFARLFNDELTLDNLERLQLVSMCQFVGISPFGTDAFLRTRLRQHLQQIKQDDFEIEQEGIENLTEEELRQACRARGMRALFGEGAERYMRRQLQDWLDLSLHRGLPSSLLLLSRAFTITAPAVTDVSVAKDAKYEKLKETLGVIPEEVLDSIALQELGGATGGGVEALQQRLAFLKREEEAIRHELERAEAAEQAAAAVEAAMRQAVQQGMAGTPQQAAAEAAAAAAAAAEGLQPAAAESKLPMGAPVVQPQPAATQTTSPAGQVEAVSLVAPEEAAATAASARERRIKAVVRALMDMATGSGVAQERGHFMQLMRREMQRVNSVLAGKAKQSSIGTIRFGAGGLEVAKDTVVDPEEAAVTRKPAAEDEEVVSSRLSDRVSRMLARIEKELDQVESQIGKRLHVLDTDADGKVTAEEVESALKFLRDQLSPQELADLLQQLKAAAKASGAADDGSGITVSELINFATDETAKPAATEAALPPSSSAEKPAPKQVAP